MAMVIKSASTPLLSQHTSCPWFYLLGLMFTSSRWMARAMMLSTTNEATSSSQHLGALIFLHGLGDTPMGWSHLVETLPSLQPRLSQIEYVFPAAPILPISINGGYQMPGWFDLYDWPIEVGAKDDRTGKLAAVAQINQEIVKLKAKGIDPSRVVVGGFSQGGAIALLTAYHQKNDPPLAGCVALSGWLTLVDDLAVDATVARTTPCFWGHGSYDDKVLFEHQKFGTDKLREQGVSVEAKQYPMGHGSLPDEIQSLANFIDRVLFGENNTTRQPEL